MTCRITVWGVTALVTLVCTRPRPLAAQARCKIKYGERTACLCHHINLAARGGCPLREKYYVRYPYELSIVYVTGYQSTRHTVNSSHSHLVTRSTRHRSTRHMPVFSHSQLVTRSTRHTVNSSRYRGSGVDLGGQGGRPPPKKIGGDRGTIIPPIFRKSNYKLTH